MRRTTNKSGAIAIPMAASAAAHAMSVGTSSLPIPISKAACRRAEEALPDLIVDHRVGIGGTSDVRLILPKSPEIYFASLSEDSGPGSLPPSVWLGGVEFPVGRECEREDTSSIEATLNQLASNIRGAGYHCIIEFREGGGWEFSVYKCVEVAKVFVTRGADTESDSGEEEDPDPFSSDVFGLQFDLFALAEQLDEQQEGSQTGILKEKVVKSPDITEENPREKVHIELRKFNELRKRLGDYEDTRLEKCILRPIERKLYAPYTSSKETGELTRVGDAALVFPALLRPEWAVLSEKMPCSYEHRKTLWMTLVDSVCRLHQLHVVWADLSLGNIYFNTKTKKIKIGDIGNALFFDIDKPHSLVEFDALDTCRMGTPSSIPASYADDMAKYRDFERLSQLDIVALGSILMRLCSGCATKMEFLEHETEFNSAKTATAESPYGSFLEMLVDELRFNFEELQQSDITGQKLLEHREKLKDAACAYYFIEAFSPLLKRIYGAPRSEKFDMQEPLTAEDLRDKSLRNFRKIEENMAMFNEDKGS